MAEDMQLRNLSPKTIDAYTYHVGRFAEFPGQPVEAATAEDVRLFQLHMLEVRKVGWSSFNQALVRGFATFVDYVSSFVRRCRDRGWSA
jgi:integrase/recombinase XerD